ncbi:MAG: glycine cleavage system aminomethyltransferase GcvT [Paramuribaculum sp.]|nr:glycine cleavage system aminomethyltransferase GcvT [Paramuribaculum sp.]
MSENIKSENKRTCLYDRHVKAGALISPFGGFEMPIQYEGITEEHQAVRSACGVFDVSHMGEVNISGKDAEKFVNRIFTNDVAGAPEGKIFYGMMLNEKGGTVDDLLVYKRGDNNFFLVINAGNIDKDVAWIRNQATGFDVEIDDLCDVLGEIAIQGPEAEQVIEEVLGIGCKELTFYTFKECLLDGNHILISRTGYTGEDGFEIYGEHPVIVRLWDELMESGRCKPCGLGCRDTLRFEVGLPLYGDELSEEITPVEAGLSMFVKTDKPDFIGRETILRQKEQGVSRKVVGLEIHDRAIARHGYEVLDKNGETIGAITTGYRGISVDKSLAMALIDSKYAEKGTEVAVKIRKKVFPATVIAKKFYKKSYKK